MKKFIDKKIGVLMGGLSEEREISLKTGSAVLNALLGLGYNAVPIDAGRDVAARLAAEGIEAAFIALHGRYGEDGCVQGMLEIMAIPYTGSGVQASSIAMDKAAAKKVLEHQGISTPKWRALKPGERSVRGFAPPFIAKPSSQGSTIGVSVVRKKGDIEGALIEAGRHGGDVIIEEFIEGRELTVSILDGKALPVIEIRPREEFYNYRAKYTRGVTDFAVPAPLKKSVERRVVKEALGAYGALKCRGAARVDVMLSREEVPYVLEVNTVPGLTELSLFPRAAAASGMDYAALVENMLDSAGLNKF